METTRKQTSFRLDEKLIKKLKTVAKRNHRSLNNYVELLLWNAADRKPNADTLEAVFEAEHRVNLTPFDLEGFKKSIKRAK